MLPRGLTSLLDSDKNKASSAAGPAAAGPAAAPAGGGGAAAGPAAAAGPDAAAAGLQSVPLATPKHHARMERLPKTCCPGA